MREVFGEVFDVPLGFLEPDSAELPVLRRGHAITWIEDALTPLHRSHPHIDTHRLAIAIRAATGIEAFVWLVDVAGLPRSDAAEMLCQTAQALLANALTIRPANAAIGESMSCSS